jgi:hypothetical protein
MKHRERFEAVYVVCAVALGMLAGGCTPESEILCGRWQSRAVVLGAPTSGPEADILPGGFELYLGHFDAEVAGIARFYDRQFEPEDDCGINDLPTEGCGCTYVENGRWRQGSRRFTFKLDGESACDPDANRFACLPPDTLVPPVSGGKQEQILDIDLRLVDDDTLVGTIGFVGIDAPVQPIALVRLGCQSCRDTLGADLDPGCQCVGAEP